MLHWQMAVSSVDKALPDCALFSPLTVLPYFWLFSTYSTRSILPTCAPWFYLFPSNSSQWCTSHRLPTAWPYSVCHWVLPDSHTLWTKLKSFVSSIALHHLFSSLRFLTISSIHPSFHPFTHSSMHLCIYLFIHPSSIYCAPAMCWALCPS